MTLVVPSMSTRRTIFYREPTHLFLDSIAHPSSDDVCLQSTGSGHGNYFDPNDPDGSIYNMNRDEFAAMCREYLKFYESTKVDRSDEWCR